jgi:hypothetical protein
MRQWRREALRTRAAIHAARGDELRLRDCDVVNEEPEESRGALEKRRICYDSIRTMKRARGPTLCASPRDLQQSGPITGP